MLPCRGTRRIPFQAGNPTKGCCRIGSNPHQLHLRSRFQSPLARSGIMRVVTDVRTRKAGRARGSGARRLLVWLGHRGSRAGASAGEKTPPRQQSARRRRPLQARPAQSKKPAPTYTKDVASILQSKCQNCHRRHQVGPFALETYEQARKRSHDIAAVTEERSMPPWKPTRGWAPSSNTTSR